MEGTLEQERSRPSSFRLAPIPPVVESPLAPIPPAVELAGAAAAPESFAPEVAGLSSPSSASSSASSPRDAQHVQSASPAW